MKKSPYFTAILLALATPVWAGVTVSSPQNGTSDSSPVHYVASASASSCAKGVASVGIYVNNKLNYVQNGTTLNTNVTLSPGSYYTVVQEWDYCGGASATPVGITVPAASGSAGGTATAGVTVSSPANNSTVTSPVIYSAIASAPSCASGVAAMGIYVDNQREYVVSASSLNTQLTMAAGAHYTVVQEWDNCGGSAATPINITVQATSSPTVSISSDPPSIASGSSSILSVSAANATQVRVTGTDGSSYTLPSAGGTQTVSPASSTTYTATATGNGGSSATASATVAVTSPSQVQAISHVVFMLQENRSFDNYFGMLNPYRSANGWNVGADGNTYNVDGIDDKLTKISNTNDEGISYSPFKLTSSCVDDMTSSWLESYGDVSRYDFSSNRQINMDGFVHTAENYDKFCAASNGASCSGSFTDSIGKRTMGYYDQTFLNYYYYMASQFALSDRWFSPVSSKSIPNRIATFTGGTTQGLVFDPGSDDRLPQLDIANIFQELDQASVSWKIYYSATDSGSAYPATNFGYLSYSYQYLHGNSGGGSCAAPTQPSSVVGDSSNSFCIDPTHIAPLTQYFTDLNNGTLPSFAFIEAGYGQTDEHPGSGQSNLAGQQQVAKVVNAFMASPEWKSSVFFLAYDEIGGTYDHVPPVPGHSNENTDAMLGSTPVGDIPDISTIAKNADGYYPCAPSGGVPTLHCDLASGDPGTTSTDAAAGQGFAAQLGFRVPNMVISPFVRKHYVSHIPMDHTAILKFVENRFIGPSAHLTARDDAQPNLLDFFDFSGIPWASPPTPPTPVSNPSSCTPQSIGS